MKDADRIPFFLKPLLWLGDNKSKAIELDFLAGSFWETKETYDDLSGKNGGDVQVRGVPNGFKDPAVINDFRANSLGAHVAIALHKESGELTREEIEEVARKIAIEQDKVVQNKKIIPEKISRREVFRRLAGIPQKETIFENGEADRVPIGNADPRVLPLAA